MSAKSLEVGYIMMAQPEDRVERLDGRMAKRHGRSVHREGCRPQGSRSPRKQFSPVRGMRCRRRRFERTGSPHGIRCNGESGLGLPGFEAVACIQRSDRELGRPVCLPVRGRIRQLTEGDPMGGQESDPLIVLGDGRADHMGKRWAGRISWQSTHVVGRIVPLQSVSRSLPSLLLRVLPEEPYAGKPHVGIC